MNAAEVADILEDIRYKDWRFVVGLSTGDFYLQAILPNHTGRKWRLSTYMTKSEVVLTALKAVLTAEEHETREQFLYRGKPVFGPHIDVDTLHSVCNVLDVRS